MRTSIKQSILIIAGIVTVVSAFTPIGALSVRGEKTGHPFFEDVEWYFPGVYHMVDQIRGPGVRPDGSVIEYRYLPPNPKF